MSVLQDAHLFLAGVEEYTMSVSAEPVYPERYHRVFGVLVETALGETKGRV